MRRQPQLLLSVGVTHLIKHAARAAAKVEVPFSLSIVGVGLAAGGQPALEQLLRTLQQELAVAMALSGVRSVAEIDRQLLR